MKYIALLRGINVGGKRIKMAHLKTTFESMGYKKVRTYLQSGNVIFEHNSGDISVENIEKKLTQTFAFSMNVIIRTDEEFESIISDNPFIKDSDIDKLHITFLKETPDKDTVLDLDLNNNENEKFEVIDREVYLYLPNGYSRTKLTNNLFEKKLKTIATTRNWKTTTKLLELSKSA